MSVEVRKKVSSFGKAAKAEPDLRSRIRTLVNEPQWERFITTLIIVNAIALGLETSTVVMSRVGGLLNALDTIVIAIFVVEITLRIYAFGRDFWRDPWSIFDFAVVAISLAPSTGNLSVLRALRVLRVLRLISTVDSMRRVVGGLVQAIPGMGTILVLLLLVFYVFAVIGTNLYGATNPELFGDLGAAAYSLLQVMTLEGWSTEIVNPVLEKNEWALVYFLPFIIMTSFAILNLFIGIIVDSMQREAEVNTAAARKKSDDVLDDIVAELQGLRAEVRELKAQPVAKPSSAPPRKPGGGR